jgi:predicted nucleic acid-binding protein
MGLLTQIPIHHIKTFPSSLYNKPFDSSIHDHQLYIFDIVGSIECFYEINDCHSILLKDPDDNDLLSSIYKKQQNIFHALADGIIDLQEEHDETISNQICIHTSFLDDDISSTLRIIIPNELIKKFKKITKDDPIKISCSLAYTQNQNTLFLTAQSVHPINSIDIVLE